MHYNCINKSYTPTANLLRTCVAENIHTDTLTNIDTHSSRTPTAMHALKERALSLSLLSSRVSIKLNVNELLGPGRHKDMLTGLTDKLLWLPCAQRALVVLGQELARRYFEVSVSGTAVVGLLSAHNSQINRSILMCASTLPHFTFAFHFRPILHNALPKQYVSLNLLCCQRQLGVANSK